MINEQLYSYNDCVEKSSPEISLYEHGVVRNSYTGETLIYDKAQEEIKERIISLDDVLYALDNMDEDFFSYTNNDRDFYDGISEDSLSEVIMHLNEYSRFFL